MICISSPDKQFFINPSHCMESDCQHQLSYPHARIGFYEDVKSLNSNWNKWVPKTTTKWNTIEKVSPRLSPAAVVQEVQDAAMLLNVPHKHIQHLKQVHTKWARWDKVCVVKTHRDMREPESNAEHKFSVISVWICRTKCSPPLHSMPLLLPMSL